MNFHISNLYPRELYIYFDMDGEFYPGTQISPAEEPEINIIELCLMSGRKISKRHWNFLNIKKIQNELEANYIHGVIYGRKRKRQTIRAVQGSLCN